MAGDLMLPYCGAYNGYMEILSQESNRPDHERLSVSQQLMRAKDKTMP